MVSNTSCLVFLIGSTCSFTTLRLQFVPHCRWPPSLLRRSLRDPLAAAQRPSPLAVCRSRTIDQRHLILLPVQKIEPLLIRHRRVEVVRREETEEGLVPGVNCHALRLLFTSQQTLVFRL